MISQYKKGIPVLVTFFVLLLFSLPLRAPYLANTLPMFSFILIFFWSFYLPKLMPNIFLFLLGLFQDAILGWPFGLSALTNLLVKHVIVYNRGRLIDERFVMVWCFFAVMVFFVLCFRWTMVSLINDVVIFSIGSAVVQMLYTVLLYPLFYIVLNPLHCALRREVENA